MDLDGFIKLGDAETSAAHARADVAGKMADVVTKIAQLGLIREETIKKQLENIAKALDIRWDEQAHDHLLKIRNLALQEEKRLEDEANKVKRFTDRLSRLLAGDGSWTAIRDARMSFEYFRGRVPASAGIKMGSVQVGPAAYNAASSRHPEKKPIADVSEDDRDLGGCGAGHGLTRFTQDQVLQPGMRWLPIRGRICMCHSIARIRLLLALALVFAGVQIVGKDANDAAAADVPGTKRIYLDQGWTADQRQRFYYTSQGSQLIPYHWFLALETESGEPFRSDAHLGRLRFIPQPKGDRNPDGLPVGFVLDDNPENVFDIKRAFLGDNYANQDYPRTNAWLGLTCAACHTAQIATPAAMITIDGAPTMADVETFLESLTKALEATHKDKAKMNRFAKQVLADEHNAVEEAALKKRVEAYAAALSKMVQRNASPVRYGFGRLDAFGAILNEICATALEIPENRQPSDAPASYPFLWETPQLDWVQWNGSANNPLARNVGEALGVFAHFSLTADDDANRFQSTVNIRNLFELEQQLHKLRAPVWPEEHLG